METFFYYAREQRASIFPVDLFLGLDIFVKVNIDSSTVQYQFHISIEYSQFFFGYVIFFYKKQPSIFYSYEAYFYIFWIDMYFFNYVILDWGIHSLFIQCILSLSLKICILYKPGETAVILELAADRWKWFGTLS